MFSIDYNELMDYNEKLFLNRKKNCIGVVLPIVANTSAFKCHCMERMRTHCINKIK